MQPKIGSKFKLGNWVWEVTYTDEKDFKAERVDDDFCDVWLRNGDASSLDWLPEPATISKEARDEIVEWIKSFNWMGADQAIIVVGDIKKKLDSMTKENL